VAYEFQPSRPLEPFPDDWSRALCVVAHPDDLEYGMAGAVAKWTASGRDVSYLLVTRGEAGIDGMPPAETAVVREAEERASARVVGVSVVEFLDGHADGIIEYGLPLRRDLAHAIRRLRPEVLVGLNVRDSWGGRSRNSPDHRNVGLALLDAAGDAGNRWVFPEDGLDPWGGVRCTAFFGSPEPTHYVDIGEYIETGIASLREHAVYMAGLGGSFDPDAFLRDNARGAGESVGCDYAVTLEVFGG
jgi:LmbE family N-acetylglucosaminyl deacetylase